MNRHRCICIGLLLCEMASIRDSVLFYVCHRFVLRRATCPLGILSTICIYLLLFITLSHCICKLKNRLLYGHPEKDHAYIKKWFNIDKVSWCWNCRL